MNVGGNAPTSGTGDLLIKKPPQGYREPQSIVKDSSRAGIALISSSKKASANTPQNNQNVFRSNSLQNGGGARNHENISGDGSGHGE